MGAVLLGFLNRSVGIRVITSVSRLLARGKSTKLSKQAFVAAVPTECGAVLSTGQ